MEQDSKCYEIFKINLFYCCFTSMLSTTGLYGKQFSYLDLLLSTKFNKDKGSTPFAVFAKDEILMFANFELS